MRFPLIFKPALQYSIIYFIIYSIIYFICFSQRSEIRQITYSCRYNRIFHKENPTRCKSVSKFYFIFMWSSTCL